MGVSLSGTRESRVAYRAKALLRHCPKCNAVPGEPCRGVKGPRLAPHQSRGKGLRTKAERSERAYTLGPAKAAREAFYLSPAWRVLRYAALKVHGGCCQCCGERPSPGNPLHVDHIKPRSKYPELELELSNLQVLCQDCNLGKSASDQTDWRT